MRKLNIIEFVFCKLLTMAFAVAAIGVFGKTYANEASITVNGAAENFCSVSNGFSSGNHSIPLDSSLNSPNGTLKATSGYINLGLVTCNYAASITVKSTNGGLVREGTSTNPQPPFVEKVNHTIKVDWLTANVLQFTTSGAANSGPAPYIAPEARSAEIEINTSTDPDNTISVIPGIYKDIITVKIEDAV